ncbi:plasmid partitioning protein RepB C-terminal domain-containing protein [Magnetospirillum gryphiswaldense]|uniref:Transcriptional regulators n=1 Tax=Magnetospirillum gryphiswaldense TaxID=55518 RepID=A4TVX3_9PROT|nr:plasmid partitioning protein RepB C-terminal domain-containing protein [Magnetospirillum gryphiswaldense]AVM76183.1 Chromosome-partitioning protein Spo0J [Magnetospirillum gryphiswaldense MSR-1]AVM80086.1 Chromosome-partitioning protein Spo0J [Magnetospirillum gryphiswaldense]CAM74780.1 transcriptional regulators [Magnetospirillum gryphiswaldense MSR-1]
MTADAETALIHTIPVDRIRVANPRSRNREMFAALVDSIASVGLKRPITVRRTSIDEDGPKYDLICGQGRLEAVMALGETTIPALIEDTDEADAYLRGLIENMARRKHTNRDLLTAIRIMEDRGYSSTEIGAKTGLDPSYISGILTLLREGEERLIAAVERGWMPIYLASQIAHSDDSTLQNMLMDAYQEGTLKGPQLLRVRRLIERRKLIGKAYGQKWPGKDQPPSSRRLAQVYQEEVHRQQMLIRKADIGEQRLIFLTSALRRLLADEHFRTLLRAEGLLDLPKPLADRLKGEMP